MDRRVMGDLINRAVRHHIKHVDHPEDPVRRPFQNRAGSIPVLTTYNNNSGVRVLLRRKVVFSTVRVRVRWRKVGDAWLSGRLQEILTDAIIHCSRFSPEYWLFESTPDYLINRSLMLTRTCGVI